MKFFFYLLTLLITVKGFAQNFADKEYYLVDSLVLEDLTDSDKKLVDNALEQYHAATHDTTRINAINEIVEESWDYNVWPKYNNWVYLFTEKSLQASTNEVVTKKLKLSLGGTVSNIGFLYESKGDFFNALVYYDKSLTIKKETDDKIGIATTLNNIGVVHKKLGDAAKALEYYEKSLAILEELGDKKQMATLINNIGNEYKTSGDIAKALEYFYKSLNLHIETQNKNGAAIALSNIGYVYKSQGDFNKALDCFHKCLALHEEIGDQSGVALDLNNVGFLHDLQGDVDMALEYYTKSLKIREEIGDKAGIAKSLNNVGVVYNNKGNPSKALEYYKKSLAINEEVGSQPGIALSLSNMGVIYTEANLLDTALDCFTRSLMIREGMNDREMVAESLIKIGSLRLEMGRTQEAKSNGLQALSIAQELGYISEIMKASNLLSRVYESEGNGMKALELHKLSVTMRDSISNDETRNAAAQQNAKYEYEKRKVIDDALYDKRLALEQEEKEKQEILTIAIAIGFGLLLVFLLFVFSRLRMTKRQKNEISQQKEVIEESHKEITDSINYTKRLQNAILPSFAEVDKHLPNNFIHFQPKNVVSGDFYWFEKMNGYSYLAAADCTGHGVPGALVSVVCSNALNRSLKEFGIKEPSKILDKTRELVIETFAKSGDSVKDGMDIALCAFDGNKIMFSGANNPLWIVRRTALLTESQKEARSTIIESNLSIIEHKANKQPIGLYEGMTPFTQEEIELHAGDTVYFFTDGFADQFGGESGKKFKYKPFKRFLIGLNDKPMDQQKSLINASFENWKGDLEQVDDVCVIGVKIGGN